ncbi:MATE family efflux transporter [Alteromonas facilis]|uniref:MATE family efflux transporter n=1 Tax=Alteromonas facilis TaxID=2048004 RepID=UPI000C291B7D
MIIANITTPLLGLVDTAVLGHLPTVEALAGASIGALVITQIYWVCGFLRMSVTGLSAQMLGRWHKDATQPDTYAKPLAQAGAMALLLALVAGLLIPWVIGVTQAIAQTDTLTNQFIAEYLSVRVFGAPAALLNLVLVGWLIGQQRTSAVLMIQVAGNLINIVLNLVYVFMLDLNVIGVAAATVTSEYVMAFWGAYLAVKPLNVFKPKWHWFSRTECLQVLSLNTAMFIRNLMLQLCLAFITFQGARLGAQTAAVNAILMQFFVLISLGLDGIAYAVEALVGEAKGQRQVIEVNQHTQRGLFWSSLFAVAYSGFFWIAGELILSLLTNKSELVLAASPYLPLIIVLPLVAHWCFLFDGVFVGLSQAQAMRNTMMFSALGVFFPAWWLLQSMNNWALWLAFLLFLAARGASLGGAYLYAQQKGRLLD